MERKRGAKENYLRIIYRFDDGKGIRSIDIAKELEISKPSVSEMLKKLALGGFVKIKPYSKIFLTKKGRKFAEKHFDRHYTVKRFMKNVLKHPEDTAEKEAKKISHVLSDETIDMISKLMEGKAEAPQEMLKAIPRYIG